MVVVSLHHHLHPRISIVTSPVFSLYDVPLSMRFGLTRHLPLKRSFANYSITSRSRELPKSPVTMATTESDSLVKTSTEETDKKKKKKEDNKEEKEEVSVPPPPEKPEPGDCCGSGCVRCVWDVYYEELEDYNNTLSGLAKSN